MDREEGVGSDVEKGIDAMESGVEEMAQRTAKLGERVDDAKADWRQKQQDSGVPGAEPHDEDAADDGEPSASDRRPEVEDER